MSIQNKTVLSESNNARIDLKLVKEQDWFIRRASLDLDEELANIIRTIAYQRHPERSLTHKYWHHCHSERSEESFC